MSKEILRCDKEADGKIYTQITMGDYSYRAFGILIADIILHVSNAYNVSKEDVFEWVKRELEHPTTEIKQIVDQ